MFLTNLYYFKCIITPIIVEEKYIRSLSFHSGTWFQEKKIQKYILKV